MMTPEEREQLYPTDPDKLDAKWLSILATRTTPLGGFLILMECEQSAIDRLVTRGHVRIVAELSSYNLYAITDAGRAALDSRA